MKQVKELQDEIDLRIWAEQRVEYLISEGMMEEALDEVRHQGDTESQAMFLKPLMQTYAANGMAAELLSEFPIYDELSDTLLNREKLMSVIGSHTNG